MLLLYSTRKEGQEIIRKARQVNPTTERIIDCPKINLDLKIFVKNILK